MTPAQLVGAACPQIGAVGPTFYFAPDTLAAAERLGCPPLQFYYLGRGGALGDADAALVTSAFGFMAPHLVEQMWAEGRRLVAPRVAAASFFECSAQLGRRCFSDLDLRGFCRAAEAVRDSTSLAALTLYAGYRAMPLVDDLPGRAMQLATVLREWRGAAHLAALVAHGIDPKLAHFLRRPSYFEVFGWSESDRPTLDGNEWDRLEKAEATTDRIVSPAFATLDAQAAVELLAGLDQMLAALLAAGFATGDDQGIRERSRARP